MSSRHEDRAEREPMCTVWVGIRPADEEHDITYVVILQHPEHHPTECDWYRCAGNIWDESDDYYHHAKPVLRLLNNTFIPRRLPIGTFPAKRLPEFEKAFQDTVPQKSGHFVARMLQKLAARGVLKEFEVGWMIRVIEEKEGKCPPELEFHGGSPPSEPASEGSQIFRMEL
ncbi:uncharacterized protein BJX67DRAFT_377397 [Aspergillus lucknowensis]|uniref:Uncharacterized protein n=1 Tax=Aspergillus lucknowensis TaxID=176173 RepID=A0ABR4M506_9EURO